MVELALCQLHCSGSFSGDIQRDEFNNAKKGSTIPEPNSVECNRWKSDKI